MFPGKGINPYQRHYPPHSLLPPSHAVHPSALLPLGLPARTQANARCYRLSPLSLRPHAAGPRSPPEGSCPCRFPVDSLRPAFVPFWSKRLDAPHRRVRSSFRFFAR